MSDLFFNHSNCDWYTFDPAAGEGRIRLPIQKTWRDSDNRMLVVMDHLDPYDRPGDMGKYGTLLSGSNNRVLTNVLFHAGRYCNWFRDRGNRIALRDWSFAAINYQNADVDNVRDNVTWNTLHERFADRVWDYIRKIKPTHVMILGMNAYAAMFPEQVDSDGAVIGGEIRHITQKSGWVHRKEMAHGDVLFSWTKTLNGTYIKRDSAVNDSNTLGMVCRHIANLYNGDLIVNIRDVKPNPIYVDTMGKFDHLMQVLSASRRNSVDTETEGLGRIANRMLSIQFAPNRDIGYFLPMWHRETPFTAAQLEEIRLRLRNWFGEKFSYYQMEDYLIMHNGRFDINVIRNDLHLPMIYREVWDTIAGDFIHDENYKFATIHKYKPFRLDQMTATYGHDYYFRDSSFNKGDRAHLKDLGLTPEVIEYGAFDVQAPFAIHECQQFIADHIPYKVDGYETWGDAYRRLMLKQMSHDVHSFAHMERRGVALDSDYNSLLRSKRSPYIKYLDERNRELAQCDNYKKAVLALKKANHLPANSLDEDEEDLLDLKKDKHRNLLFFDVMRLPWDPDPQTGNYSTDEEFQEEFKEQHREVALFSEISVATRIKTNFIDAFARQLQENEDSRRTGRIHPDFNFQDIITGRSNCRNPSLQQTPKRGEPAKFVKRQFYAPPGTLLLKSDYSAHEVRMWGNAAGDKALTDRFWIGRNLRKLYASTGDKALLKEIKGKGDLHRFNYEFFFGVPADQVTEEQRDGVKQIIFGAIYEKSIASMAATLGKSEEDVQKLYDALFSTFRPARDYLDNFKEFAYENLFSYSRIGRMRHLPGFLTDQDFICSALARRSVNAPIQGISGDILHTALRITAREQLDFAERFTPDLITEASYIPGEPEAAVHDAMRFEAIYRTFVANMQIMQWCMTGGVTNFFNKMYGFTWMVPTEIDVEVGYAESDMKKWDWYLPTMEEMTMGALEKQAEQNLMPEGYTPKRAHDEMWTFYDSQKDYLNKRYPFFFDWDYEKEKANAGAAWQ